jgi:hypothetical protein
VIDAPVPRAAGDSLKACTAHQKLDGLLADRDSLTEGQLGVHPASAVGVSRLGVHSLDQLREPDVTELPR